MNGDPFDPLFSKEYTPILTERRHPEPSGRHPERSEGSPVPVNTMAPVPAYQSSVPAATHDDLRVLSYQLEVMQKRVKELEARRDNESRMEMLGSRWEEFLETAEYRFQKIQSQFQKQHELYKAHFRDLQSKVSVAMGWMKERSQADANLYESIEEQRQTIQAFEGRMQQWQKVISEHEMHMLSDESDKNRVEKMQAHLQRQYEVVQAAFKDMQAAINTISNNSSRTGDKAINELVERQRDMQQTFELRMQQAQKIMNDQELQMTHSRAELKEVLKELARLRAR